MPPPPTCAESMMFRVSEKLFTMSVKCASTLAPAAVMVIRQVVPVQSPPKPSNRSVVDAVSVTRVFSSNRAEQLPGQLIPAGLLVTLPGPVTFTANVPWTGGGACTVCDTDRVFVRPSANVAVAVTWNVRADVHVWLTPDRPLPVPPSPKVQSAPTGCGSPLAVSERVTSWPTWLGLAEAEMVRSGNGCGGGGSVGEDGEVLGCGPGCGGGGGLPGSAGGGGGGGCFGSSGFGWSGFAFGLSGVAGSWGLSP